MSEQKTQGIKYTRADIDASDLFGRIAGAKDFGGKDLYPPAVALLSKYGYEKPSTETELAHKLASIAMNVGESAFKDLAGIHPDKDLILKFFNAKMNAEGDEKAMNDCGCQHHSCDGAACKCGGKKKAEADHSAFYDTAVETIIQKTKEDKQLHTALLICGTALVIAVIWKVKF